MVVSGKAAPTEVCLQATADVTCRSVHACKVVMICVTLVNTQTHR